MTPPEFQHLGPRLDDIDQLRNQARLSVRRREARSAVRDLHRAQTIAEELAGDAERRRPAHAALLTVLVRVIELEAEIARGIADGTLGDVSALSEALIRFSVRSCAHGDPGIGGECGPECE
ncbi:hypothetical protein [Nocardia xishanensis]|uniref:hypothetical protein n=1 Tax=Nocardia xishanensis TaxID=238964 RepID=UPI000835D589|nr:hypothetical protein [Nocardia xishanensis]